MTRFARPVPALHADPGADPAAAASARPATSLLRDDAPQLAAPPARPAESQPPDLDDLLAIPSAPATESWPRDVDGPLADERARAAEPLPPDLEDLLARLGRSEAPDDVSPPHAGVGLLVGVVAPDGLIAAAAGGVAAWARKQRHAGTAVVAIAGPSAAVRIASPRAGALVKRLVALGFDASASAAQCRVLLPVEPIALAAEARRLRASTDDETPVVIGVAARDAEVDDLLATADDLILALPANADPALAELARTSLTRLGPPVGEVRVPSDPIGRRTAALGLRPLAPSEAAGGER